VAPAEWSGAAIAGEDGYKRDVMASPAGLATEAPPTAGLRDVPLDLLRTCLVLLVVVHHAALGYHAYAPPQERLGAPSMAWTAFPIVDAQRLPGVEVGVAFNDLFLMSLLFLISGVFAWPSLVRKGARRFVHDRMLRLGVPFAVAAAVLGPLAYYPTYLAGGPAPDVGGFLGGFWRAWLALGFWPAGPVWFLWVLLVFDALAALLYAVAPGFGTVLGRLSARLAGRPVLYAGVLALASALAYVPLAMAVGAGSWWRAGPFTVQTSRILHYAIYFLAGIGLGADGVGRGLLAPEGALARRWSVWIGPTLVTFGMALAAIVGMLASASRGGPPPALALFGAVAFVLACAATSCLFLGAFLRFARTRNAVSDSLRANAYGIYVVHYACVTWLQYLLSSADVPAAAKLGLVVAGTVAVSWSATAALRRIPAVAAIV